MYKIKPENVSKPIRTVRWNLLLKCNELPFQTSSSYSKLKVSLPQKPSASVETQTESESSSDSEFVPLEKLSKPKGTLPPISMGQEQSVRKSDHDTDSGGDDKIMAMIKS